MQKIFATAKHERFANLIKKLHEDSGLGQRQFAAKLETTHTTIRNWKEGETCPECQLDAIAKYTKRTHEQLMRYINGNINLQEYLQGSKDAVALSLVQQSTKYYSLTELNDLLLIISEEISSRVKSTESLMHEGKSMCNSENENENYYPTPSFKVARRLRNLVVLEAQARNWGKQDFVDRGVDEKIITWIYSDAWLQARSQRKPAKQAIASLARLLRRVKRWENDSPIELDDTFYETGEQLWTELDPKATFCQQG